MPAFSNPGFTNAFNNGTCLTNSDCLHGLCIPETGRCFCNVNVVGKNCHETMEENLGVPNFVAWRVIFCVLFFVTSSIIVWKAYGIYKERRGWSLKAIGHLFVFLLAFFRFLFFAMDPMWQRGAVPLTLIQLIFGFAFVFDFTAFLIVLLYWVGVYHFSMKEKPKGFFFKKMRVIFYVIDGIWFVFEFVYRMMIGLDAIILIGQEASDLFDVVYNIYIALICLGLSGGFAIYGFLLIRTLSKAGNAATVRLQKLTNAIVILSGTFFITVLFLIAVILAGGLYTATGAVGSYSVGYLLEILLCFEMIYIMRAEKDDSGSSSSRTVSSANSGTSATASSSVSVSESHGNSEMSDMSSASVA